MATAELELTDTKTHDDIQREVEPVISEGNAITVNSAESYQSAVLFLQTVKSSQKRVTEFFQPMKQAAHEAWKKIVAAEKSVLDPLENAERLVKKKAGDYQAEEERKRIAEQRRLQAEADEIARKERERIEKAAAKLKTPELREERMAAAATIAAPVIQVATSAPKIAGVSTRKIWKARVLDPMAVPREYLIVNEKALDAFAKATKGSVKIPGVEFYSEQSMAVGGGR